MGCSNKRWGQARAACRDKPSNDPKTRGFGFEYGYLKIFDHGDDRHSKNGFRYARETL
jgi:hypothetical protein